MNEEELRLDDQRRARKSDDEYAELERNHFDLYQENMRLKKELQQLNLERNQKDLSKKPLTITLEAQYEEFECSQDIFHCDAFLGIITKYDENNWRHQAFIQISNMPHKQINGTELFKMWAMMIEQLKSHSELLDWHKAILEMVSDTIKNILNSEKELP